MSVLNILEEIFRGVVGVDSRKLDRTLMCKVLDTLVTDEVKLHPVRFSFFVNPLERVGAIAVHVAMTIRNSPGRERNQNLHKAMIQQT